MYFYYCSGFIHNVSASNPVFKNISVNATTKTGGT